ncbi:FecCD family ABC transporter permease [Tomitella gaofuii]|uniref:FecCD family ABC transporter permease n=1 Tax=Tomitella gaofuii TaxID=2760083 RepID=UPI0015FCFFDE|nr:iron ABC transporter permease [Tomitella gaofuii]
MIVDHAATDRRPGARGVSPTPLGGKRNRFGTRRHVVLAALLLLAVLVAAVASLLFGSGDTGVWRAVQFLVGGGDARADEHLRIVVMDLRLPRTFAALLIGVALGVAGALLQAVTRNPLAETGLLGVNAGGALGVVSGIMLGSAGTGTARLGWAFAGALIVSAVVLLIAAKGSGGASPLRLVLAGAAIGATVRGVTAYLLLGKQASYDEYRWWILGSLSGVSAESVVDVLPFVIVGVVIALASARPLSALSLGDETARSLGHRPKLIRSVVVVAVTLLTAASVAVAGPVAFVGLLAPYIARAVVGTAMVPQLLFAGLAGALAVLVADVAARLVIAPYEAPVAVLLALIGAPLLIVLARSPRLLTLGASKQGAL